MTTSSARLAARERAALGESPVWDPQTGTVTWIDIPGGTIFQAGPDGRTRRRMDLGEVVGALLLATNGWLVGTVSGLLHLTPEGTLHRVASSNLASIGQRFNDGACYRDGTVFLGTVSGDFLTPAATLERLEPGGRSTSVLTGLTISNGIGWSPEGDLMYHIDTVTRRVDVYDFDPVARVPIGRRTLVDLREAPGRPDGLCLDVEGGIWVALLDGGRVHRFTPDGRLDHIVEVPASRTSACGFGGTDGTALFVTTGTTAGVAADEDLGGSLFIAEPGVAGLPATPWPAPAAPGELVPGSGWLSAE